MQEPLRIVVDAGGTRTRVGRVDGEARIVARLECGPGNVRRHGVETVAERVLEATRELTGGRSPVALAGGFAGCARADEQAELAALLAAGLGLPAERVVVRSDLETAWRGALGGAPGVLLLAGTGSAAFSPGPGGELVQVGGLGPRFDDRGSGHWLGRRALESTLCQVDGREAADALGRGVLERLGLDGAGLLEAVRADRLETGTVADLAREVAAAVERGEPRARRWVREAAAELATLALAAVRRARLARHGGYRVSWAGGLLTGSALLRGDVREELLARDPAARWTAPLGDGLDGACSLLPGPDLA